MRKTLAKAIAAALVMAVTFGGLASAGASAAPRTSKISILSCAGKVQFKPSTITVYCADGNGVLEKIKWTSWTATKATATDTYSYNSCEPNCASGKFASYPGSVKLTKPKSTKYGELFSAITVEWLQNKTTHDYNDSLPLKKL